MKASIYVEAIVGIFFALLLVNFHFIFCESLFFFFLYMRKKCWNDFLFTELYFFISYSCRHLPLEEIVKVSRIGKTIVLGEIGKNIRIGSVLRRELRALYNVRTTHHTQLNKVTLMFMYMTSSIVLVDRMALILRVYVYVSYLSHLWILNDVFKINPASVMYRHGLFNKKRFRNVQEMNKYLSYHWGVE